MALTRGMLKGMGLTDEQISGIIEAHSETVTALKDERDKLKEDAEKAKQYEAEIAKLKADTSSDEWQKKYEDEHSAFEAFKTEQAEQTKKATIKDAYKKLLLDAGVTAKRVETVLKVADLSACELEEDGTLKDAEKLTEAVKAEWSDFIESTTASGAQTTTPPYMGSGTTKTKADILAIKDSAERQKAIAENPSLFGI